MLDTIAYGRIASNIPLNRSKSGKYMYTTFLLASHKTYKKYNTTTFIRCVAFDAMATLLHNYFATGDRVIIKGELISDDYNNTNKNKFSYKIKVKGFEFVENLEEHNLNKAKHLLKEDEKKRKDDKKHG